MKTLDKKLKKHFDMSLRHVTKVLKDTNSAFVSYPNENGPNMQLIMGVLGKGEDLFFPGHCDEHAPEIMWCFASCIREEISKLGPYCMFSGDGIFPITKAEFEKLNDEKETLN